MKANTLRTIYVFALFEKKKNKAQHHTAPIFHFLKRSHVFYKYHKFNVEHILVLSA